jgi:hypothetical protein
MIKAESDDDCYLPDCMCSCEKNHDECFVKHSDLDL